MVKRAFLAFFILSAASYGSTYQLDIVKEKGAKLQKEEFIIYKVKRGDTLTKILQKFGLPKHMLYELVKVNKIKNPNLIYQGQKIKVPIGRRKGKKTKIRSFERELKLIKSLGAKVETEGFIFTRSGQVNLKKFPLIKARGNRYIVDLTKSINGKLQSELEEAGFTVFKGNSLKELIRKLIQTNFSSIQENGKLILGERDILTYKFDFMGYSKTLGLRTVINLSPDTPPSLVKLLNSYGILVIQPPFKKVDEGNGKLRIVKGDGLQRINSIVYILTGHSGVETEKGLFFPKLKLYIVYDFISPDEKVKLELKGNKVFTLSGNIQNDIEGIVSLIPLATKWVKLILYEPPPSKGRRSKFSIRGLLVSTPKKDWFLIDRVDKVEELQYLTSRGVNLIVY